MCMYVQDMEFLWSTDDIDDDNDARQCPHNGNSWLHRLISIYAFGKQISGPEVLRYCVCMDVCLLSGYVKAINEELKFFIFLIKIKK